MRLVLCHSCWSWVGLSGTACPDCFTPLDVTRPDPTEAELAELIGDGVTLIAPVRIERRTLPHVGALIGTTRGLLFLPDLAERPDGSLAAVVGDPEPRRFWNWLGWWSNVERATPRFQLPADLQEPATAEHLAAAIWNAPGGWILPAEGVHRLRFRGQQLLIWRVRGSLLSLQLLSPADAWRPAWRRWVTQLPPMPAL